MPVSRHLAKSNETPVQSACELRERPNEAEANQAPNPQRESDGRPGRGRQ